MGEIIFKLKFMGVEIEILIKLKFMGVEIWNTTEGKSH